MNIYIKYFSFLLFTTSLCLSDSGYNTIYLMEFDNLKNNFTYSHLKEALPDLIKENYKFREDIKVEYAGNISPYIEKYKRSDEDSIKGLIINGSFDTINEEFYIEFEAYDIQNWEQLVKRQIFCPIHDIICVHDAFLISIESSISPFLSDQLDLEATIRALEREEKKAKSYDLDQENTHGSRKVNNNPEPFDLQHELDGTYYNQEKYGNRYYREFNLKKLIPQKFPEYEENSRKFSEILEQILSDPCNVVIGDLYLELDPYNSELITAELPIQYSMMNFLSQELLRDLPHEKYLAENNNVILQFSKNDFIFDDELMEKLALMQLRAMPVISFNDKIGRPQFIILDSWNDKYESLKPSKISILMENQFKPLFAVTPGTDKVLLTLSTETLNIVYRFSLPYEKIGDYTKVTVKFMQESELDKLLEDQYGDN